MEIDKTADGFFYEKTVFSAKKNKISPLAHFYIISLLSTFISAPISQEPLGIKLLSAHSAPLASQIKLYKEVGDTSLFLLGMFPKSINGLVKPDYYQNIGIAAYSNCYNLSANIYKDRRFEALYSELTDKFPQAVSVIGEVSGAFAPESSGELLVDILVGHKKK